MTGDAVFKLFATLGLNTDEYDESLDNSEKKGSNFGKGLKTATKVAAGAIAAVTATTVAGTKAFVDGVSSVAQYGDNIEKTSQKVGLGITKFQEWDYVMNIAGTSMNNMSMGMKTLTNQLDEAKNGSADALSKFEALGLSFEDLQNMSREEVFEAVIGGFQGMAESTERAALANDLFGRSGQELTPLFNMTQEETQELIKTANEYGMVMSEDAVKASATFQDSLTTMQNTMAGLKNNMLSEFLPSFSTVMDGLSLVFSGDSKSGLGLIKNGVKNLVSTISELTPTLVEVGGGIVEALTSAVVENLPAFIESGLNALGKFVDGIVDNADTIITAVEKVINIFTTKMLDPTRARKLTQTAINIIVKISNGLTQALPQLIPAIASVIAEIVRTLTQPDNLSALIQCAIELMMALTIGLIDAIPEIVKVIPEIVVNIVAALIENTPLILETLLELVGAIGMSVFNLIGGLLGMDKDEIVKSITEVFNTLVQWGANCLQWFKNLGSNIKNGITGFFDNAKQFFENGINNIKEKVTTGLDNVKQTFTNIFDKVKTTVKGAIDYVKSLFKFDWQLPKLKLPHFKITGKFSLDPTNLQMPKISVEWYKKAMDTPYILEGATIFGKAGDKLLGGGESGSELVVGTNKLMKMIKQATGGGRDIIINIYGAEGQDIRELAKLVGVEMKNILDDKESVYA